MDRAWTKLTRHGVPLVERIPGNRANLLVTFVWRPPTRVVAPSITTPIAGYTQKETELRPLAKTGVWYRSFRLSRTTRASYGFSARPLPDLDAPEKEWSRYMRSVRPDPLNPSHVRFGPTLALSVFALPGAPRQPWGRARGPSRWKSEKHEVRSRRLGNARSVWVFVPPAFDPRKVRYNVLIVLDGDAYQDPIPTPRIVENLVAAGRIPPTVAVLVGNAPGARARDLTLNPAFPDFLAQELLPWLARRYRLRTEPLRTVLAGSSLGGLAAAHAALRYPELFGKVLAQSGAFLTLSSREKKAPVSLMEQFAHAPRLPLRFYLDAGTHEKIAIGDSPVSLLGSVRHMRDVLEAKGYPVTYAEFEGGHDYACWRGTLADGLVNLLGRPAPARKRAS